MHKPCHPQQGVPILQSLLPPVLFLPLRWSQIMLRPITGTLVFSTKNNNDTPKSEPTGRRPDFRNVESWKSLRNAGHEAQSMNGGGRSMSHNEKRGPRIESMCLDRRKRGLQSNETYRADDIDTKLPQT